MLIDFTVPRRGGLVASLDADRFDPIDDGGVNPDEGSGDGSQPSDGDAPLDALEGDDDAAGDPQRRASAEGDDEHDDDDEEEDERYAHLPVEERLRKLSAALRKKKRIVNDPTVRRVRELSRQGISLSDLENAQRQYAAILTATRNNPRLKALLFGGGEDDDASARRSSTARQPAAEAFTFDDSVEALGFDVRDSRPEEGKANRVLGKYIRLTAELDHRFKQLEARLGDFDPTDIRQRVDGVTRTIGRQSQQSVLKEWTDEVARAEALLTDPNPNRQRGMRTLFRDAMQGAMEKVGGRRPAREIVTHYLKSIGIDPRTAGRRPASAATRQAAATAQRVNELPRQPGAGVGAPARQKREKIADVARRWRGQPARS